MPSLSLSLARDGFRWQQNTPLLTPLVFGPETPPVMIPVVGGAYNFLELRGSCVSIGGRYDLCACGSEREGAINF
jgi:hypothetical protein